MQKEDIQSDDDIVDDVRTHTPAGACADGHEDIKEDLK